MNKICEILFSALRSGLFGGEIEAERFQNLTAEEWQQLFRMAAQQGVVAIVYDVVAQLPRESHPPRSTNIQWALSAEAIEARSRKQLRVVSDLADQMKDIDVRMTVLKGISFSTYYPKPLLRECGDCDCYMFGEHLRAEAYLSSQKVDVDAGDYKHSHFKYKGVLFENHKFFTKIRDGKKAVEYELQMRKCLYGEGGSMHLSVGSNILIPCDEFNILMYLRHASVHFLTEGLTLRHLCDWALILQKSYTTVNWERINSVITPLKLHRFASILTSVANSYFGLSMNIAVFGYMANDNLINKVGEDLLFGHKPLYSKASSSWQERFGIVWYALTHSWKYHKIMRECVVFSIIKSLYNIIRNKRTLK